MNRGFDFYNKLGSGFWVRVCLIVFTTLFDLNLGSNITTVAQVYIRLLKCFKLLFVSLEQLFSKL